jgi:hypothetical protein
VAKSVWDGGTAVVDDAGLGGELAATGDGIGKNDAITHATTRISRCWIFILFSLSVIREKHSRKIPTDRLVGEMPMHNPAIVVYALAVASILTLAAPAKADNVTAGSSCTREGQQWTNNGPNNTTATCECKKQKDGSLAWECSNYQ